MLPPSTVLPCTASSPDRSHLNRINICVSAISREITCRYLLRAQKDEAHTKQSLPPNSPLRQPGRTQDRCALQQYLAESRMSLHHSPAAHPRAVDSPAEELGLLRDATGAPHELSPVNSPMNQASRQSLNSLSQTYTVPSLDTSTKTKTKKEKLKDGRNIEIEAVGVDLSTLEGSPLHAQLNRVESAAPKTKKLPKQTKPKILVNPQPQQQFRQPPTQAQRKSISALSMQRARLDFSFHDRYDVAHPSYMRGTNSHTFEPSYTHSSHMSM